jgi:hypothetical protein
MPEQQDLNTPVSVTLPLGAWNTVLGLIMKGSWDIADPLIQVMRQQIIQSQQPKKPKLESVVGREEK